jgi:hypothetical protein
MKQGVRGDVSVETVSGEVAEISDALNFDINWIMSIMPVPMYMLGAFQEGAQVGQFGGIAQQQETQRQIKDTRRDIEEKFTPVVQQVAEQMGVSEDAAESIRLKVGSPGQPEPETTPRENIIRYVPKDQREPQGPQSDEDGPTTSPGNDGLPSGAADRQDLPQSMRDTVNPTPAERRRMNDDSESSEDASESLGAQLWHHDGGIAQLSISDDSRLSDAIYETMVETRDDVLSQVSNEFENAPMYAASHFEQKANSTLRDKMSRGRFRDRIEPVVEELVEDDKPSFAHSNSVRFYAQNIENATEDALEEMLRLMRIQVRRGANNGEELNNIINRVEQKYNDAKLRERAELIAHMESKNIVETIALQSYESDSDVIGVRVSNENPSTPLTQSLAGSEAYFDDGPIHEQLMAQTREEFLQKGFDPLPPTPPYHFNDTTTLEPIYKDS